MDLTWVITSDNTMLIAKPVRTPTTDNTQTWLTTNQRLAQLVIPNGMGVVTVEVTVVKAHVVCLHTCSSSTTTKLRACHAVTG